MNNRSAATAAIVLLPLALYCFPIRAQCSLNIQSGIGSGWDKDSVSYRVEKNTLTIKSGAGVKNDTDSIYIGSIKGCSTLTIEVLNISGQYPWGGKAIGFSFANDALEPHKWGNQASFPSPRERAIEDGFIRTGLSNNETLLYDIDNSAKTTHIGAKVFIGSNASMELRFSALPASREPQIAATPASSGPQSHAQEASRDPQFGAQQPALSSRRYTADSAHQSGDAAASCALNCHEHRAARGQFAFTRQFTLPLRDACRAKGE